MISRELIIDQILKFAEKPDLKVNFVARDN